MPNSNSKKIAIATPVFPPYCGGIGSVALQHARLLSERGCGVTVFTPWYGRENYQPKGGFTVELLRPAVKSGNAALVPQLKNKLKNFDSVLLEYPFFGGMRAVYKAKKKYNFKLVLNYNMDVVGSGIKGMVFWYATKFFLPRIVKASDIVLASSADYAQNSQLGKYWEEDNPKFKVLPIGVDVKKFLAGQPDEEFRHNLNIKPEEKIFLFVGGLDRAHYFKGIEYLIKSVPLILKQSDNFKIIIAGRGELQKEYMEQAKKMGVKNCILFTGGVSDKALVKLYQLAYAVVLPSIDQSESFGIVLAESMSCGNPVIASDLPGVRSVFEHNKSGLSVKPRDAESLANAILFLLNNPEKREEMSKECVNLVTKKYTYNKIGDKLLNILIF